MSGLKRRKKSESGQSTIEFALTLILLMSMVLFYVQLSLVMAFGNYVHYATFMAARAYLSAGREVGDQKQRADAIIQRMLKRQGTDRFPQIARGVGGQGITGLEYDDAAFQDGDPGFSWLQGVRYKFKSRLFVIPLGKGVTVNGPANSLTLTSESFLGREITWEDCDQEMKKMTGYYDNGC